MKTPEAKKQTANQEANTFNNRAKKLRLQAKMAVCQKAEQEAFES